MGFRRSEVRILSARPSEGQSQQRVAADLSSSPDWIPGTCQFSLPVFGKKKEGRTARRQSTTVLPPADASAARVFLLKGASMPRHPKPFFHRGWWVTDVGGQRTKLAFGRENRKQAEQAFHELLAKACYRTEGKTTPQLAVWEVCDKF